MIPLYNLGYIDKLDRKVLRFVNDTIKDALESFIEMGMGKYLIPKGCFRDEKFNYKRKLDEVINILSDDIVRIDNTAITPINEFIIYSLISEILEIESDTPEIYAITIYYI